jgi:hypothetical protein
MPGVHIGMQADRNPRAVSGKSEKPHLGCGG